MRFARDTEDLTGRDFGLWKVLRFDETGSKRKTCWIVRCRCGNESSLSSTELRTGRSKSCRCLGSPDLTGKIFGQRTVIERAENQHRARAWLCRCSCGREDEVRAQALLKGKGDRCEGCAHINWGKSSKTHGLLVGVQENQKSVAYGYWLMKKYGLTRNDYESLVADQKGLCAICLLPPGEKPLFVDHCHSTKRVRGLLCQGCNFALGLLKDDPIRLRSAAAYLEKGKMNGKEESSGTRNRSNGQDIGV